MQYTLCPGPHPGPCPCERPRPLLVPHSCPGPRHVGPNSCPDPRPDPCPGLFTGSFTGPCPGPDNLSSYWFSLHHRPGPCPGLDCILVLFLPCSLS